MKINFDGEAMLCKECEGPDFEISDIDIVETATFISFYCLDCATETKYFDIEEINCYD